MQKGKGVYYSVDRQEGRVRPQRDLNSFEPEAITINLGRTRAAFYQLLCHLVAEVGRQGGVWSGQWLQQMKVQMGILIRINTRHDC